jgi:hypothetical protein
MITGSIQPVGRGNPVRGQVRGQLHHPQQRLLGVGQAALLVQRLRQDGEQFRTLRASSEGIAQQRLGRDRVSLRQQHLGQ